MFINQYIEELKIVGDRCEKLLFASLIFLAGSQACYASTIHNELHQQLKFTHLSTKEGLAQNSVRALTQDNEGFIWIATQSGLHRYDGYRLQTYSHNPQNENSIANNLVLALTTDDDGYLWAGTFPAAINQFNAEKGTFTSIPFPQLKTRGLIKKLYSTEKKLWVAIDNQFFFLNKSLQKLSAISIPEEFEERAITILKNNSDSVWLVKQTGLYLVNKNSLKLNKKLLLKFPDNDRISSAIIHDSNFYIGTEKGKLYHYNVKNAYLEQIWMLTEEQKIGASTELSFLEIAGDTLWIASNSNGLIKYSLIRKSASIFTHNPKDPSSISENNIRSLLIDNSGLIWTGTSVSGVDRTTGESSQFALYQDKSGEGGVVANNDIRARLTTLDGKYWLATSEGMLKQFSPETNQYKHFPLPKINSSLIINIGPSALVETTNGDILYGSKYGLWKFSREEQFFNKLSVIDNNNVDGEAVLSFYKDNLNRIWVGSSSAGVGLYNEKNENITWFPVDGNIPNNISNFILHLTNSSENLLWVGSSKGISRFNTTTGKYQQIIINKNNQILSSSVIRTLYQNKNGTLWIGTLSGVFLLQQQSDSTWNISYPFSHIKSLSSNIYAFLTDRSGDLWISSNFGLTKLEPETGNYQVFTSHDGLQGEEFNGNIAFKTNDNRLWFGGLNGLNAFNPEKIKDSLYQPPIWITGYQIDDVFQEVSNPAFFSELTLPEDTQILRLEFASLDYAMPERNLYRIKQDNFDQEWIDLENRNEITYTQLHSGTYKICFLGTNRHGVWNNSCRSLLLTMEASIWQTTTAFAVYFFIFLSLLFLTFYFIKKKSLIKRNTLIQIQTSKDQLSWALEGSGNALWIWDTKQYKTYRQGLEKLLGYDKSFDINLKFDSIIHPDDSLIIEKSIAAHIRTNSSNFNEIEYRMKDVKGNWVWILDRGKIVERDGDNIAIRVAGTFQDISIRKKAEESSQLSAMIIRNMAEMVMVTDENFRIISANPAWCHKMGYQLHEILGKDPSIFRATTIDSNFYKNTRKHLFKFGSWQGEMPHKKKNSQEILTSLEMTLIKNLDQSIRHIVSVCSDITEKKRAEENLRHLANYDMLTNLPNRTLFLDRLEHAILQAQRHENGIALLFIDLDNFKNINDTLGHTAGDQLLKEASKNITNCVRKEDTVSRLGGDEFTVIIENVTDGVSVFHIAEKIIESFSHTLEISGRMVSITPSIGISLYPDDANNVASLVQYADTAMYYAKSQGKNNFQFYAQEMNQNALRRLEVEGHLRSALSNNEFHIAYQPKVETVNGKITGMEALLRWNNPVIGQISPVEFIPLAEDSGLIVPIGEWILLHACRQAKKWVELGHQDLNLSVNLSFRQFKAQNLPAIVSNILNETGLQGKNLTLEITESLLMDNVDKATQQLKELKELDIKVAIDDFGTGYSSLNYLKQFPIDYLKIDRTFIKDILTNQNDASLTSAIITLSHNLDLAVIAEGVEQVEQLMFLQKAGCEEIQGFLVSPPIAGPLFESLLVQSKNENVFTLLQKDS